MHYKGNCHCGAVSFAMEGDLAGGAVACNCSICSRKGAYINVRCIENIDLASVPLMEFDGRSM